MESVELESQPLRTGGDSKTRPEFVEYPFLRHQIYYRKVCARALIWVGRIYMYWILRTVPTEGSRRGMGIMRLVHGLVQNKKGKKRGVSSTFGLLFKFQVCVCRSVCLCRRVGVV